MFSLTVKCPSAFQNSSLSTNSSCQSDNCLPDNSTYPAIFSKGVKQPPNRSLNGGFIQKIILFLKQPILKGQKSFTCFTVYQNNVLIKVKPVSLIVIKQHTIYCIEPSKSANLSILFWLLGTYDYIDLLLIKSRLFLISWLEKNLDFTVYQSLTLERQNIFIYHYGL